MNILMTGATGLVGQALSAELLNRGHAVVALVRDPVKAAAKLGGQVRFFKWNGEEAIPADALANVEGVIHLAGENVAGQRWTKARKQALRDSRLVTAARLNEGLREAKIQLKVFFTASGVGFYGDRGDTVLSESDAAGTDFLAQLCVEWEAAADQMPAARKIKGRFGVVLRRGEGFLGQVVPLFNKLGASRLGSGKQWMPWIHIEDLVHAVADAIGDEHYVGAINFVSPNPATNTQLTHELGRAIGAWPGPPAPSFALRILYGELADALLFSQRALPARLEALGFNFRHPRLDEALRSALHLPQRK